VLSTLFQYRNHASTQFLVIQSNEKWCWRPFTVEEYLEKNSILFPGSWEFVCINSTYAIMLLQAGVFLFGWCCLRSTSDPTRWPDFIIFTSLFLWNVGRTLDLQHWGAQFFLPTNWLSILAFTLAPAGFLLIYALASVFHVDQEVFDGTRPHPLVLRSRTTHTRLFPKKHSFSYPYLQVSIPVGFENHRCGNLVSVGNVKRKGWFHVQASDYLDRKSNETTFKGKLTEYLASRVHCFSLHHHNGY
jgi:hypothetical protein